MLPVVALIGRPNVGKSTLFNAMTGTRDALVADLPGLTRDRQYGFARRTSVPCIVVDTGGLVENADVIESLMIAQTDAQSARRIGSSCWWMGGRVSRRRTSSSRNSRAAAANP